MKSLLSVMNPPKDLIMGIDCSTKKLAFCLLREGKPERWGEIYFQGDHIYKRIADARKKVKAIQSEFDVDLIAFESAVLANTQNVKVTIMLSLMYGAVISQLLQGRAGIVDVLPNAWMDHIGNHAMRKADTDKLKLEFPNKTASWYTQKKRELRKNKTIAWVKEKYDITVESDDVADAFGLAWYLYDNRQSGKL